MKVTILAVTRMGENRICVAGINEKGEWIRPIKKYPEVLVEEDIIVKEKVVYAPFNVLNMPYADYKMLENKPHSEDCEIKDYSKINVIDKLSEKEKEKFLIKYAENDFLKECPKEMEREDIADILVKKNRSLILIGPVDISSVSFRTSVTDKIGFKNPYENSTDIGFIPCTDIRFRETGQAWLKKTGRKGFDLKGEELKRILHYDKAFLALGLTRFFHETGKYHLMVIGVHTIPDYKL